MVLRFSCPCGAPYALADHLAGRTFTCTSCGTVLQIGTVPAPPAAPPAPAPPAPNLRQSGVTKPPSGGGPQPNLRQSGVVPPQTPAARKSGVGAALPPPPPKTNELALADDDPPPPLKPLDDDEEEEEGDEDDEEGVYNSLEEDEPKPRRPTSSAGGKAMRTSGVKKTSGVGKGAGSARLKKTSAGHRALPPEPAGIATMSCPVCETEVPRVAASCHSCGVRLRAAGVGEKLAANWKGPAKSLALLAAAGTIGFVIWKAVEPTPPRRPLAGGGKTSTERPATERSPDTAKPPDTERPVTERPATEQTPTTRPPPTEPKAPTEPKPVKPPPKGPTEDPPPSTERAVSHGGGSSGVTIPPGPHAADLTRLRDAPQPLQPLLAELAANADLVAAAQATLAKSVDQVWHLRVLRLRLLAGDAAARRTTFTQLLTTPPEDEAQTLHLAQAALDLDPVGLDAALAAIAYGTNGAGPARAFIDLVKAGTLPPAGAVEAARGLLRWVEADTAAVLAPVLLAGGDGSQLDLVHAALSGESPSLKKAAAAALAAASVGSGPTGDDPAAWRAWIDEYRPRRDLLVKATTDPEARAACRVKARELLPALGPFLHEGGGQPAARVVADVIAMGAGPGDAPVLARLLDSLVLDAPSGTHVVRAALFAADEGVSDSVAAVIARGGASVELLAPSCPDLLRPARGKAVETLQTWAYGQSDPKVQKALQLLQASFRVPALEAWVLLPSDDRSHREAVGARLASPKVEAQLLKQNDGASLQLLAELCGEETADKLAKAYADAPRSDLAIAVRRACDRKVAPRLKKIVETTADQMVGTELLEVFARITGREAGPSLLKRMKDGDPFQRQARTLLMKLGAKEALPLARAEFEAIDNTKLPSSDALATLLAVGEPSDTPLLRKCMSYLDKMPTPDQPWVIMGFGLLGEPTSAQELRGYLRKENKSRGQAAIALAILNDADAGGRIKAIVDACAGKYFSEDGMSIAALGALDPEGVGEVLKKYPAELVRSNDELLVVGASFGLARGGHDDTLQVMARGATRKFVARGVALASLSKPGELPRLKLLDDLRTDPDPAVRAEAALAYAASKGEEAAREALLALATTPDEVLDAARSKGIQPIMALAPGGRELTTLRAGLWAAYAIASGQPSPLTRVELPRGRQRELVRQVRAATLR